MGRASVARSRWYFSMVIVFTLVACISASQAVGDECVPPPPGLVSWWPGDGDASDLVGTNDGTLFNGATFAAGRVHQAFSLDGVDDYVATGDVDLPFAFTLDAWIFPVTLLPVPNYQGAACVLSKAESYFFCFDNLGKLVGSVKNSNGSFTQYRTTEIVLSEGQWNHVALAYDGSLGADQKMTFYVNGQSAAAAHLASYDDGGIPNNSASTVMIGMFDESSGDPIYRWYFPGIIDEVELVDRALSGPEVQSIVNAGSAGKCTDEDGDGFPPSEDCDETDPSINPNAVELPGNLIDENCDGDLGACSPCLDWKNHGEYVRCVAHAVEALVASGAITEGQGDDLVANAARSNIGKKGFMPLGCH